MAHIPRRPRSPRQRALPTLVLVGTALLLSILLARTGRAPLRLDSGYQPMMGTYTQILLRSRDRAAGQAAINAALDQLRQIDALMSYQRTDSELAAINAGAFAAPVEVNDLTFEVLWRAVEISRLSDGDFDVTIAPLVDLWNRAGDSNAPPSDADIAAAQAKVGWEKLRLDPEKKSVAFTQPGMRIDLGGIAKGYAIDKAVERLRQLGETSGMVDVGGDIRCFNPHGEGRAWRIGIETPPAPGQVDSEVRHYRWILQLHDKSVATSGHYRRFVLVDGQRVSHILDAHSGRGGQRLQSVTVLADDAMTADALATAVSVMGEERGLALVEETPGVEALIIVDDPNRPLTSSGLHAFLLHD